MMEEITMYRKLVPLICAMLLSTAAFGQGGGGVAGVQPEVARRAAPVLQEAGPARQAVLLQAVA